MRSLLGFARCMREHGLTDFPDPRADGVFLLVDTDARREVYGPEAAAKKQPPTPQAGDRLVRDYFGMHRIDADDEVVFQLPYGEWIRLFRAHGFEILDLIEPRPAPDAVSSYRDDEERAWSRRWPAECIWRLRRA